MRYQASVVLEAPIEEMRSRIRTEEGSLEPLDDDLCRYRTQDDSLEWLALRLLFLGVDFQLEGPPELADQVGRLATRLERSLSASDR